MDSLLRDPIFNSRFKRHSKGYQLTRILTPHDHSTSIFNHSCVISGLALVKACYIGHDLDLDALVKRIDSVLIETYETFDGTRTDG
jgi:hypothetical protein